jgi:hypothetical protein
MMSAWRPERPRTDSSFVIPPEAGTLAGSYRLVE